MSIDISGIKYNETNFLNEFVGSDLKGIRKFIPLNDYVKISKVVEFSRIISGKADKIVDYLTRNLDARSDKAVAKFKSGCVEFLKSTNGSHIMATRLMGFRNEQMGEQLSGESVLVPSG